MRTAISAVVALAAAVVLATVQSDAASRRAAPAYLREDLSDLRSRDPEARADAANRLALVGPQAAVAIPALMDMLSLGGEQPPVEDYMDPRAAAVGALVAIGNAAVPRLLAALHSPKPEVRADAATALGTMKALPAVRPLLALLDNPDRTVGIMASAALGSIGQPALPPAPGGGPRPVAGGPCRSRPRARRGGRLRIHRASAGRAS